MPIRSGPISDFVMFGRQMALIIFKDRTEDVSLSLEIPKSNWYPLTPGESEEIAQTPGIEP